MKFIRFLPIILLIFSVNIYAQDVEAPFLTSLTFSPASIDVSGSDQSITFNANVTDNISGIKAITVALKSPSGNQQRVYSAVPSSSLVTGDSNNAILQFNIIIFQYAEGGIWYIDRITIDDNALNSKSIYEQELISMGFETKIIVTSNSDTEPPELADITFTPNAIDVSGSDQSITFNANVTDNISGIKAITVALKSPSGNQQRVYSAVPSSSLVAGDSNNAILQFNIIIFQYAEGGIWYIDRITIDDNALNSKSIYEQELISMGFETKIIVTSNSDTEPPELADITFTPNAIDVSGSDQSITFNANVTDNISGIKAITVALKSPSGNQQRVYSAVPSSSLVAGDSNNAILQFNIIIFQYAEGGIWYIDRITIDDNALNSKSIYEQELISMGFETKIILTNNSDTEPPILTDFSFSPASVNVSNSDQGINFSFTVADNMSGLMHIQTKLTNLDYNNTIFLNLYNHDLISGNSLNGTYQKSATIPQYSMAGTWSISQIILIDSTNNQIILNNSDITNLGFDATFQVISNSDTEPPVLTDFSFSPASVNVSNSDQGINFSFTVADNMSGLMHIQTKLTNPDYNNTIFLNLYNHDLISGNSLNGTYQKSATIPQYSMAGTWSISQIILIDSTINQIILNNSDITNLGFDATFQVISNSDTEPPVLTDFSFSPASVNVSNSDQGINFSFTVADNMSGLMHIQTKLTNPDYNNTIFLNLYNHDLISGNSLNGTYQKSATIPQYSMAGTWSISQIILIDSTNNQIILNNSDITNLGFDATFQVISNSDTEPPILTDFSFSS